MSGSFNDRLLRGVRSLRVSVLRRLPPALVPPLRYLSSDLTIAVTTFAGRYRHHFLHLHRQILRLLPEVPVVIAVNGGPDQAAQASYLQLLESEVCDAAPPHHHFLLHDGPVDLTDLWNGILAASPTATTLILYDLCLDAWFRRWIEVIDWPTQRVLFLNGSWSHFAIGREVVRQVWAFESAFPGIGFEDMDYDARLYFAGIQPFNLLRDWIHHLGHLPGTTSFDTLSGRSWGKYTSGNEAVFYERWQTSDDPGGSWMRHLLRCRVKHADPPTPLPLSPLPACLRRGNPWYPQRTTASTGAVG